MQTMRWSCLGLAASLTVVALPARAALLEAKRASVMCVSAGALAKLARPDGGSRDVGDHVPPAIAAIARVGDCTDFPKGHIVILETARGHTSIVRSDSLSGDGVMIEAVVANIDFGPYAPPHTVFTDTIRKQCPGLLDGIAAEDPPRTAFIASLPPPVRTSIGKALDDTCGPDGACLARTEADEIGRRHLDDRWATFLCAHPADAIEPDDRTAGRVRD